MTDHTPADLSALRAAIGRIEAGGMPHHSPPGSSPDATPSGDDRTQPARDDEEPHPASRGKAARDPHAVAKAIVLRQLTNSPKTRAELEEALAKRDCDPLVAKDVLDRLTEVGLVDDAAYAQMFVRSKQRRSGLAASALRRELRAKGVDPDTAGAAVDDVSPALEEERARELVRSRLKRLHGLDRAVQVRRLAGLLARKGYPSGMASKIIFDEIDQTAEHARD